MIPYLARGRKQGGRHGYQGQGKRKQQIRAGPRQEPGQLPGADSDQLSRHDHASVPQPHGGHPRRNQIHLRGTVGALPAPRLGAQRPRHWRRRHDGSHGAQRAAVARMPLRGADDRRRAQSHQLPARRRRRRLHPRPWGGPGAHRRQGVLGRCQGGPGKGQGTAAGLRHRRSPGARRRAHRRGHLRGLHRRRRSGIQVAPPRRRVGGVFVELHLWNHRRSQGRRLSPQRALPQHVRHDHRMAHAGAPGLPMDPAHVPRHGMVFPVGGDGTRRHPRHAAPYGAQGHFRRHRRAPGRLHVRRPRCAQHDCQLQCRGAHPLRPRRPRHDRRFLAARPGDHRHGGDGLRGPPHLWPHRGVWADASCPPGRTNGKTSRRRSGRA